MKWGGLEKVDRLHENPRNESCLMVELGQYRSSESWGRGSPACSDGRESSQSRDGAEKEVPGTQPFEEDHRVLLKCLINA